MKKIYFLLFAVAIAIVLYAGPGQGPYPVPGSGSGAGLPSTNTIIAYGDARRTNYSATTTAGLWETNSAGGSTFMSNGTFLAVGPSGANGALQLYDNGSAPIMNSTNGGGWFKNGVQAAYFEEPTNSWVINTAFGLGTNAFLSQGASTFGFTGVANGPSSTERYGQLTIVATGTITFTNPVSVTTSDYVATRTVTNGNTAVISVDVIPNQRTNMAIVQFR